MRNINLDQAAEVLQGVVTAKGADYVYPGSFYDNCMYWDRDEQEPSCLVGHYFWITDLINSEDDFLLIENSTSDQACTALERWGRAEFTDGARDLLYAVQNRQDAGWTWGRSLEFAHAAVEAIQNHDVEDVHDAISQQIDHDDNNRDATLWGWQE